MTSPDHSSRGSLKVARDLVVGAVGSWIAAKVTGIDARVAQVLLGWIGAVAAIGAVGIFLIRWRPERRRHGRTWVVILWVLASGVIIAEILAHSHVPFEVARDRWVWFEAPVLVTATLMLAPGVRRVVLGRTALVRRVVTGLVVLVLATMFLLCASDLVASAVGALAGASTSPPHKNAAATRDPKSMPGSATMLPPQPAQAPPPRVTFPLADSVCVVLSSTPPATIDAAVWAEVLTAEQRFAKSWALCPVGSVQKGSDGIIEQKVFSRISGPEGAVLARRDDHGNIAATFVPPQIGELYYQQPGGDSFDAWGFPGPQIVCGEGRLVIFTRPDHTITGFSLWSKPVTMVTTGPLVAYYTPAAVALPLLTALEPQHRALPLAVGSVQIAPDGNLTQFFAGRIMITSEDPSTGTLTKARLLALCPEPSRRWSHVDG